MINRIECKDLQRSYNSRFSLRCSFSLKKGIIYTLMGPNGSGKSTLMRMLALLERPDDGTITFSNDERRVNPFTDIALRRRIVLVGTHPVVFRESVMANVLYGLKLRGVSRGEARRRAEEALGMVGLGKLSDEMATVLSSGERQRLSLARAIAISPDVLLLDEPTVNLDPENRSIIERVILSLSEQRDRIILLVTHDIFQAKRLSEEVLFMFDGEITEQTRGEEFFALPKTDPARRFLTGEIY
ncbi:MAG: ATP-binding cassette domain-containing protein [Nitrospirae bacterium]|nr:MAG: ATP-binding cassette domain-containing protein [Nitrospirota bacterium]